MGRVLQGLNSNIKHEGRVFHIQTEDSGSKYGHVISHLYLDGGILASIKHEYKDKLELPEDEFIEAVTKLMRKSHREMVRKLSTGTFNEKIGLTPKHHGTVTVEKRAQKEKPAEKKTMTETPRAQPQTPSTPPERSQKPKAEEADEALSAKATTVIDDAFEDVAKVAGLLSERMQAIKSEESVVSLIRRRLGEISSSS